MFCVGVIPIPLSIESFDRYNGSSYGRNSRINKQVNETFSLFFYCVLNKQNYLLRLNILVVFSFFWNLTFQGTAKQSSWLRSEWIPDVYDVISKKRWVNKNAQQIVFPLVGPSFLIIIMLCWFFSWSFRKYQMSLKCYAVWKYFLRTIQQTCIRKVVSHPILTWFVPEWFRTHTISFDIGTLYPQFADRQSWKI